MSSVRAPARPEADARGGAVMPAVAPRRRRTADRFSKVVAVLIGFASIFSTVVAWRASVAAIDASRLESLGTQQQARREQLLLEIDGTVAHDMRFVAPYVEHTRAAEQLREGADDVREADDALSDDLVLEAHARLALVRALTPFFMAQLPDPAAEVPYDDENARAILRDNQSELRDLHPEATLGRADRAEGRAVDLLAVGAILVASLFFLTIAQIVRRRLLRVGFGAIGAVATALGVVLFAIVEICLA